MINQVIDSLVVELNTKLGDRPFYTLRELTSIGFFGSMSAARMAVKEGCLTHVKISKRRVVIPRSSLFEFLRNNLQESGKLPRGVH